MLLSRLAPGAGLVIRRQTLVCCCQIWAPGPETGVPYLRTAKRLLPVAAPQTEVRSALITGRHVKSAACHPQRPETNSGSELSAATRSAKMGLLSRARGPR